MGSQIGNNKAIPSLSLNLSLKLCLDLNPTIYHRPLSHTLNIVAQSQGYQCSKSGLSNIMLKVRAIKISLPKSRLSFVHLRTLVCPSQGSYLSISGPSYVYLKALVSQYQCLAQGSRLPNSGLSVSIIGLSFAQFMALIIFISKNSIKDRSKRIDRRG